MIQRNGTALVIVVGIVIFFSLDFLVRHMVFGFALLVPFLIKVIDQEDWPRLAYWIVSAITLFASRFWLTINAPGVDLDITHYQRSLVANYPLVKNQMVWLTEPQYLARAGSLVAFYTLLSLYLKVSKDKKTLK